MNKVSIIIPTYNYGFVLGETLDSVLSQTYHNWECIIVDDGSSDNTAKIANEYLEKDNRFLYFYQENSGVSAARNRGVDLSTGDFIQFLDGDDLLSPEKLFYQIEHFKSNPDIDISYTNNFYFRNGKPDVLSFDSEMKGKEWMYKLQGRGIDTVKAMLHHNIAVISSPLLKRSVLKQGIRFPTGVALLEDWIFWLQLAFSNCSYHFLDHSEAFTSNRLHALSVTKNNLIQMKEGDILIRSKLSEMIEHSNFGQDKKQQLHALNKKFYNWNFKKLLYQVGPWNFKELNRIKKYVNPFDFVKYYLKTIYHQLIKPSANEQVN